MPKSTRKTDSTITIDVDSLRLGDMPGIDSDVGGFLAGAASVCLHSQGHVPTVELFVDGDKRMNARLRWTSATQQQLNSYGDMQEATEYGACGVAIVTVRMLTHQVVVIRQPKGRGYDYWLAPEGKYSVNQPLFQGKARLEISGILKGTVDDVSSRVRAKKDQIVGSAKKVPAYVAVVEFSNPRSTVVQK